MSKVNIRRMVEDDVEAVYVLGKQTPEFAVKPGSPGFWRREQLRRWLNSADDILLVAEANGEVIGFILSQFHQPTGKATLENLVTKPGCRRQGIATDLLTTCLDQLRANGVTYVCGLTHTENIPTITFLQKHDFQRGHNFAWMAKEIISEP